MNCEMTHAVQSRVSFNNVKSGENLEWLKQQMHPYFFITNTDQAGALANLATGLHQLVDDQRLVLADRKDMTMIAQAKTPGSLYRVLREAQERDISYLQINTSYAPVPQTDKKLEVLRFSFDMKKDKEIADSDVPRIPEHIWDNVFEAFAQSYGGFDVNRCARLLKLLWLNNETYVRISPAERVARILWLYQQTLEHEGVYLDVEKAEGLDGTPECRILFGAGNPPLKGLLPQLLEIFKRLNLKIRRAYALKISDGKHPYLLSTFYVSSSVEELTSYGPLFKRLQEELYHTQILPMDSAVYRDLVLTGLVGGADASLIRAFIGFCHTNLAHNHPDSFDLEGVVRAFNHHPEISTKLVELFRVRFDPDMKDRERSYQRLRRAVIDAVENFNSGRKFLDEYRRTIFRCCLSFIQNTLKTNFFVEEKHALAFRIDPAYLDELNETFTSDLPAEQPFRVTYFSSRFGSGYHIGFSDIARGGWRTLLTHGRDEYVTCANTLFKENYVLAHTQHLKNKDIYEGGSKMVAILDVGEGEDAELKIRRLYKLQYGFINAFLDLIVTDRGAAQNPRVVDYYRDDEPVELGPDENMHDSMVELIAKLAVKRNYLLGKGIMSSKQVGINHKEFGVTSTGVVRFAEIALQELGIDAHRDAFSVKLTGGPNGDVAGNAMRLLLERCPQVRINLIVDGTAALFDPQGADRSALQKLVLRDDLQSFAPAALNDGGFIIYRLQTSRDGMRKLYKMVSRSSGRLEEQWISSDEFYQKYDRLIFETEADLFIPAGGRPETIDAGNWQRFLNNKGQVNTRVIVEGANSFITQEARNELQRTGVVILRDASANKCGVISSSYEIIANLLLSDQEFLANKERYVADVIDILNRRSEEEARLIFCRHRDAGQEKSFTEISEQISRDINELYAKLFVFFADNLDLCNQPIYRQTLYRHLPKCLATMDDIEQRINELPMKIKQAVLASEIASSLVYNSKQSNDFQDQIECHLRRLFNVAA